MYFVFLCLFSILPMIICRTADEWKSRTIYQILTDRFASSSVDTSTKCNNLGVYCGGNYQGLISKLDYIAGMGFDAIWISPMPTNLGNDYHGYAFLDLYTPNPHFGSADDLKQFVNEAHKRDIWVMLDVVGNHVAPVDMSFDQIIPFNQSQYYHNKCQIEDWSNQYQVENCRLSNLPDLNQDNSFVRSTLLAWIGSLQATYNFDGYRVDTVPEVSASFWSEFQSAANAYCVGEVFNGDIHYVSSYQKYLNGVLSYPLYFTLTDVFARQYSMTGLETLLGPQGTYWDTFQDVNLLGTFVDNHDNPRFLSYKNDWTLYKNALVLSLFTTGIPIVYYGAEQGFTGGADPANRESLWPHYATDHALYAFLTSYISVRKSKEVYKEVQVQRYAARDFYAFSRGPVLVCLTNAGGETSHVSYTVSYLPYVVGQVVCNAVDAKECLAVTNTGITVTLTSGLPKVYVPQ